MMKRASMLLTALAMLLPSAASAAVAGPPYEDAGSDSRCSSSTNTYRMICAHNATAAVDGRVTLSTALTAGLDGDLPGTGSSSASADIAVIIERPTPVAAVTYTVHISLTTAEATRTGRLHALHDRDDAHLDVGLIAVGPSCFCQAETSVQVLSAVHGPSSRSGETVGIPITLTNLNGGDLPAGYDFIQVSLDSVSRIWFNTGSASTEVDLTVTGITAS